MAAWYAKQIGPLPAGAWIAVLAGGLGLSYFVSRGAASKILAEPGISTGTPTGVAEGPGPGLTPITTGPIPVGPVTNEEWAARAIEELVSRGHPIELVEPAITHYVAGSRLTAAETVYKNLAIGILGYPPLPIPITPLPPPVPPRPRPRPTRGPITGAHGTRLTSAITLINLARRYAANPSLGDSVEGTKRWILSRNPWLVARGLNHNNSVLKKGWIIIVPSR